MAARKVLRAVAVLTALVAVVAVHGEGSQRESLQSELAQARAALRRAQAKLHPGGVELASEPESPDDHEDVAPSLPNVCPNGAPAWKAWYLDTVVPFLLQTEKPDELSDEPYLNPAGVSGRASQVKALLAQCKAKKLQPPAGMLPNLSRFIDSRANADPGVPNPQHQLGHGITDGQYLCRARKALEVPCLLRSQVFLRAMAAKDTKQALNLIDLQNTGHVTDECVGDPSVDSKTHWTTITYRSRFLTTPDHASTLGRLLVVAPATPAQIAAGVAYDRWVQFGIWTPDDPPRGNPVELPIHNVSVVAISKGKTPSFDAMIDWYRCTGDNCKPERQSSASTVVDTDCATTQPFKAPADGLPPIKLQYRLSVTGDGDDCQACHKSLPLSIHPTAVYDFRQVPPSIDRNPEWNNADLHAIDDMFFESYQHSPVWQTGKDDKQGNPMDYGAYPFAPITALFGLPNRTARYIQGCAIPFKPTQDEIKEMRRRMNCAGCHNGTKDWFGMINYPQATEKRNVQPMVSEQNSKSNRNLIKAYILDGIMPHGMPLNLSREGREAVYRCLSKEYFDPARMSGLFIDWLKDDVLIPGAAGPDRVASYPHAPKTLIEATSDAPVAGTYSLTAQSVRPPLVGEEVFNERCSGCHSLRAGDDSNHMGPSLAGILRRAPAQSSFANYSTGLQALGRATKSWTPDSLNAFIANPHKFLKTRTGIAQGSTMNAFYPDANERRAIVDFLARQP